MKRRAKIGLSLAAVAFGAVALSGCTKSFCSQVDLARMKYAFEPGISVIAPKKNGATIVFDSGEYSYTINNCQYVIAGWEERTGGDPHAGDFVLNYTVDTGETAQDVSKKLNYYNSILKDSRSAGYVTVDGNYLEYLKRFDYLAFIEIFNKAANAKNDNVVVDLATDEGLAAFNRDVSYFSYARFVTSNYNSTWTNWNKFDTEARKEITAESPLYGKDLFVDVNELSVDECPSTDFIKFYKSKLNSFVAQYRTCLTTYTDKYGSYGYSAKEGVFIEAKTWRDAWSKGFFEGLLVYPIGWLVDSLVLGFQGTGVTDGVAALLGIIFVTFIIRTLMPRSISLAAIACIRKDFPSPLGPVSSISLFCMSG